MGGLGIGIILRCEGRGRIGRGLRVGRKYGIICGVMDIGEIIHEMAVRARRAAGALRKLSTDEKNRLLLKMADCLEEDKAGIFAANEKDIAAAKEAGIPAAMVDRLTLTEGRFASMVEGVRFVATLADPVGEIIWERERPSGIRIKKVREPFGVVAVVFESRPNVFVDTAALCLKAGNAIILRGGKEAIESNKALAESVGRALGEMADAVQLVKVLDHAVVREMVRAVGLIDVAIPRGGERLIRAMCEAALIPVLKHYKGVCHTYVDGAADLGMAMRIIENAKVQRPSACNACECVLVSAAVADEFLPRLEEWAKGAGVKLHRDGAGVEYLGMEMNVAVVKDVDEAISYINTNSSHHSDAIVTGDKSAAEKFLRDVDSACVYHNASTRFTDGAEFGMGAEIGISTDKLHARGPMGLEELTTYKYVVEGEGTVRE